MKPEGLLKLAKRQGLLPTTTGAYVFRADVNKPAVLETYISKRYGIKIYANEECTLIKGEDGRWTFHKISGHQHDVLSVQLKISKNVDAFGFRKDFRK